MLLSFERKFPFSIAFVFALCLLFLGCGGSGEGANQQPDSGSPRCDDRIRNGDEVRIDCGGSCDPCRALPAQCTDGVKNGNETDVDCGGDSCDPCPAPASCTDGVKNGSETGVDCGGSCPACAGGPVPKTFAEAISTGGWPGPSNTGYPAGTAFKNTSGRTITKDNTVIDGEKITGGLTIDAQNVIVRNCWVTSSFGTGESVNGTGVITVEVGATATIENCLLDGSNRTHSGIWYMGNSLIARGNNILGVNDGIFAWDADNFTLEDNYLHDFTIETANGHVDGFQTEGASNGIIRHNTFEVTQGQTAAISIWNSRRNSDDILVENNLMAGGGFTVYAEDYSPSEASPAGGFSVTNIVFKDNKFSNVYYGCVGDFGVWYVRGAPTDGWNRTGNIVIETSENIDSRNPIVDGFECR